MKKITDGPETRREEAGPDQRLVSNIITCTLSGIKFWKHWKKWYRHTMVYAIGMTRTKFHLVKTKVKGRKNVPKYDNKEAERMTD